MSTKKDKVKILDDLVTMLTDLEDEIFEDRGFNYFNGKKYNKSDWKNYIAFLKMLRNNYYINIRSSTKYLKKNPTYNRLHRKLSYYTTKVNKKPNDYKQIEKIRKELKKLMEKKAESRDKIKKIEREIEENRRKFDNDERGIQ